MATRTTGLAFGASLLLSGCAPTATVLLPDCVCQEGAVEEGWIPLWQGYGVRWEDLSHRLAYFRAGLDLPNPEGDFNADLGILGGDWSDGTWWRDYAEIDLGWTWFRHPGAVAWFGEVELRVRNQRNRDGRATQRVVVDLDHVGLPDRGTWVLALRGVCYDTALPLERPEDGADATLRYDPRKGWTVRGLGAGVGDVSWDAEERELSFDVWSTYATGKLVRDIRPELVASMPYAQINTRVRYALIGLDQAQVAYGPALEASRFYPSEGGRDTPIPPLQLPFVQSGAPGPEFGISFLRSWGFQLNERAPEDDQGRYLRAWSARVLESAYTAEAGRTEGTLEGHASHASMIQEGDLDLRFTSELGLLQLQGASTEVVASDQTFRNPDALGNWETPVVGP